MTSTAVPSPLVGRLLAGLEARAVTYCHWKSNDALGRSASGENDLDLLVSRASAAGFISALDECGFKEARLSPRRRLPGILDYYGYDQVVDRLIHVHAHYQLVLGHDLSKNYHLSIEEPYLNSSRKVDVFPTPAVEFEYIVFIIRMMLKHGTWEARLVGGRSLNASETREFMHLESAVDRDEVRRLLRRHLPSLDPALFEQCARALGGEVTLGESLLLGHRFLRSLDVYARRPRWEDVSLKMSRRLYLPVRSRLLPDSGGRTLAGGGAVVAVVGGDGSGKTTAVEALYQWLRPTFRVRKVHMGKPSRSLVTRASAPMLRAAGIPHALRRRRGGDMGKGMSAEGPVGPVVLMRKLLVARDRYAAYRSARGFAADGGIVVADRFPLSQIRLMDGGAGVPIDSQPRGVRLALARRVNQYYQRIQPPDVLLVLRVDPEVAVMRKTDETEESVRRRSTEVWGADWTGTGALVVDAGQTKEDVLLVLKEHVWSSI